MNSENPVPPQMAEWLLNLPQQNVGTLYATIKTPLLPIYTEHKVRVWGQVCDGRDHKASVHLMLYNSWPNHGRGFTYVSWRAVPDNPDMNHHPRTGKVADPRPFNGIY
jgi:hypothetical protein